MIAAPDPQEFVPSGRQQALNHPGPLDDASNNKNEFKDDFLLDKFEKVSITDTNLKLPKSEWWILRKAPNNFAQIDYTSEESDRFELNKSYALNHSDVEDLREDLLSLKSTDSNVSHKFPNKRLSDNSPRFPNKRFSMEGDFSLRSSPNSNKSYNSVPPCSTRDLTLRTKCDSGYLEDELYVTNNTVIWSRGLVNNEDDFDNGRKVVCSFTTPLPVKYAIWCTFYRERPSYEPDLIDLNNKQEGPCGVPIPAVCIVDNHNIRVYTPKGEDFVIAVPFRIGKIWTTKFGMIIEKDNDESSKQAFNEPKATLFSLAYPIDDVCPVAITTNNSTASFLNNPNLEVVFISEEPSICMIYDSQTKQHSVYRLRKIKNEEKLELTEKLDCSMSNKLKSRLSMWDNLKGGTNTVPSSPVSSRPASVASFCHLQQSKSHSSMATMSRCQSPSASPFGSPWLMRVSRLNSPAPSIETNSLIPTGGSFFDNSKSMSHMRTKPAICLEHLWTDQYSTQESVLFSAASKAFLSEDFAGQWYLCYIIESRYQLSIVRIDFSTPNNITFGMLTSISAKDAVAIPHLHMLAILEHNGNVTLYSGLSIVGKLHIGGTLAQHTPTPFVRRSLPKFNTPAYPRRSSMLPHCKQIDPKFDEHLLSPVLPNSIIKNSNVLQMPYHPEEPYKTSLTGLKDATGNRFTLKYSDGTYYRINLPTLAHSTIVESCLNVLRQCLQRDAVLTLMTRWYVTRNALGTRDITSDQEWNMFISLLIELLGYDDEQNSSEIIRDCISTPSNNPKRIKHSSSGSEDDWFFILNSNQHKNIDENLRNSLNLENTETTPNISVSSHEIQVNTSAILFPYIRLIHYSLHLLYEDLKMNTLRFEDLKALNKFLCKLSNDLGLEEYSLYYWKDFPLQCKVQQKCVISSNDLKNVSLWPIISDVPVSIFQHINLLLLGENVVPYPYLKNVNSRSRNIVQLCGVLAKGNKAEINVDSFVSHIISSYHNSFSTLQKSISAQSSAVEQVVLLMTDMKITLRYLETLPSSIYLLFYSILWRCRENPPSDWPADAYYLLWRDDLAAQALKFEKEKVESESDKYGMYSSSQLQEIVYAIKQCDVDQQDGMEDIDNPLMKLRFPEDVRVAEARKMLQSSKPVPIVLEQRSDVSDHDFIEEQEKHLYAICTRTMALPVGRGMFTLRTATPVITEPLPTPTLCLTGKAPPRGTTIELNHIDTPANMSLWPLFHNGVANGLRITPDAHNIDNTWIIFNKPKGTVDQQMIHAGFLMALGLNGHLKNLAVLSTYDYLTKLHEMTSVGILLGLSAAFRGTSHSSLTKTLSIHVEALLPPTSMELDVPQNLQVASLLGIGLVYQGTAHRHMTEVLLSEIGRPPGPEMENSIDRESYSLAAGLSLGLVTLKQGGKPSGLADLNVPDMLHYYMVGGNKRPLTGSQKDKYKVSSFQIREGSSVNLDVTAPGATLALGLMYLGSGNKAVADWMSPPETQYLLDFVRPDFLMLRILSKSLILWNDIEPSKEWVENQVPATIRPYCMIKPSRVLDIDYEAMNQAYCNIVTGACFALGLKFAGSADEDAFATLLHFCHMFTLLTAKSIAELAGKPTIETCLNVLLISAAMVMAGTGNLEVMRLVRHLRRRVGVSTSAVVTYGSHLTIHMALGLLFLGGGRYTLSNSSASVAALICAFYPKFPTHSNDNRYHLQAFRHLYVLAVEPRLVIPKEVHLGKSCYANLRIVHLNGTITTMKGPGIIPDLNLLLKVEIDDDRYWPVVFERGRNWDILTKILSTTGYIEVKQRAGCLSYIVDKFGYHSQLARTLTHCEAVPWVPPASSIISFTSDQAIKFFCDHFLIPEESKKYNCHENKLMQMLTKITYDSVIKDKLIVVPVYSSLLKILRDLEKSPSVAHLWQLKLISTQILKTSYSANLLQTEVILALEHQIINILDGWEEELKQPIQSYLKGDHLNYKTTILNKLACYVCFYDLPYRNEVSNCDMLKLLYNLQSKYSIKTVNKIIKFQYGIC